MYDSERYRLVIFDLIHRLILTGTANPEGEEDAYNGLYMTKGDIADAVRDNAMDGLPVKIEHKGVAVGKVITSWINNGKMDLLIDVDEGIFEGNIVSRFVRDGVVNDLSLGYNVGLQFSEQSKTYVAAKKTYNEVSIVRTGARSGCHINGYSVLDKDHKRRMLQPHECKPSCQPVAPATTAIIPSLPILQAEADVVKAKMIIEEIGDRNKRHKRNEFDQF